MRLGKKIPPYPILNKSLNMSSYKNYNFSFSYELEETKEIFRIKNTKIETNSLDLINYFNLKKLKAVVIVECSSTIYRNQFEISTNPIDIEIPIKDLNDKVEISCFVYAIEDIENYSSHDMQDAYQGYTFNIEKYSVFAVDDGITMKIEYDDKEDNKVSSIFSVIKSFDQNLNNMKVELNDRKIKITLPEKSFEYYDTLKDKEHFQSIFFSILGIPALTYAFSEIQKFPNETEIDDIIDKYGWFKSIVAGYKKTHDIDLDFETFKQLPPLELSQDLMNNCTANSFDDFYKAVTNIIPNEMEDE